MRRRRKQAGSIVQISGRWFLRYYENRRVPHNKQRTHPTNRLTDTPRNSEDDGLISKQADAACTIERVKVSHCLGDVTTRGKSVPADIADAAERHMMEVNQSRIRPQCTVSLADFIENTHLPFVKANRRASTYRGYQQIWEDHVKPLARQITLKNVICADVQSWFDEIGKEKLAKNTLSRMRSFLSGAFKNALRLGYFTGANPARDVFLNPHATKPKPTYAYSFEEITKIMNALPEPASTIFCLASFSGLRRGEIEGLRWEDIHDGEMHISRSIWNGVVNAPKTEDSTAAVPLIPLLAERLERHRLRSGSDPETEAPKTGPVFRNSAGHPLSINNVLNRQVRPSLDRCEKCGISKDEPHVTDDKHDWVRDPRLPEWHGWHSCRRGLGSNLYHLGVQDLVIQKILRHADVSTTQQYYVKVKTPDARKALVKLGKAYAKKSVGQTLTDTQRTLNSDSGAMPGFVN